MTIASKQPVSRADVIAKVKEVVTNFLNTKVVNSFSGTTIAGSVAFSVPTGSQDAWVAKTWDATVDVKLSTGLKTGSSTVANAITAYSAKLDEYDASNVSAGNRNLTYDYMANILLNTLRWISFNILYVFNGDNKFLMYFPYDISFSNYAGYDVSFDSTYSSISDAIQDITVSQGRTSFGNDPTYSASIASCSSCSSSSTSCSSCSCSSCSCSSCSCFFIVYYNLGGI